MIKTIEFDLSKPEEAVAYEAACNAVELLGVVNAMSLYLKNITHGADSIDLRHYGAYEIMEQVLDSFIEDFGVEFVYD